MSKTFTNDLSTFATGYADIGASKDYGALAGFTYNFGPKYFASSTGAAANGSLSAVASMTRVMDGSPGSYGWQVSRSAGGNNFTQASGAFTGGKATAHADAFQQGDHGNGDIAVDGALVMADGGVFLGNRIDDAFAIVDAGAPDVPVTLENRPAGSTGADGKLLVPGLLSYEKNHLSVDVRKLPVTADVPMTQTIVVPRGGSGVNVNFGVKTDNAAAMVIVTDAGGKLLPVGTTLTLENQQQPFVIGYDGTAYLTGLKSRNAFSSTADGLECSGEFSFHAASGRQQTIGPIACR